MRVNGQTGHRVQVSCHWVDHLPCSIAMTITLCKHKESRETSGTNELQILCMCRRSNIDDFWLRYWTTHVPVLESYILMYLSSWAVTMMGRVGWHAILLIWVFGVPSVKENIVLYTCLHIHVDYIIYMQHSTFAGVESNMFTWWLSWSLTAGVCMCVRVYKEMVFKCLYSMQWVIGQPAHTGANYQHLFTHEQLSVGDDIMNNIIQTNTH